MRLTRESFSGSEAEAPASELVLRSQGSGVTGDELEVEVEVSTEHLADPLIGVVVADRYRILEPLGRGGMGVVYKVEHARIGKLMALKLLTGELSRDTDIVNRFKREALMASKLSHPNTVQVFDFGTADGLTYLAMEYLRGEDLGRIIRRHGTLGPTRTSRIIIQVSSSLAEAHDKDIVHRDLKPENIFILQSASSTDVVKVLDFGLAKLRESSELREVTSRGAIVGTPYYMSPEQIRGDPAEPRSDVYSLGALMYACLTGTNVFESPRPMGILTKHLTEQPIAPHVRFPALGIPPSLGAIVMRALEKDASARFQSVRELQRALVEELRGEGGQAIDVLLDSGRVRRLAESENEAATRDEVERYERKLRRRFQFAWGAAGATAVVAAILGWRVWSATSGQAPFEGLELEPNDVASDATPLPFGVEVRGYLGKRLDATRSDRDFYRVAIPQNTSFVRIQTSSLPNLSTCTLLYRAGLEAPIGRYCSGVAGLDLVVPALEVQPGEHLLAVMQDGEDYSGEGGPPVHENVSDMYRLRVTAASPSNEEEHEPNDTLRDSLTLPASGVLRGRLAWMHDLDVVCTTAGRTSFRFVVDDARDTLRAVNAVLLVTPVGGPADGIPVRVHRDASGVKLSPRDAVAPWRSPELEPRMRACLELRLMPNPWAPTPHPRVAPAGPQRWAVRVEDAP